jgi:L-alanine-DL-glutamate epimerase-like enolase superfamily enzyme
MAASLATQEESPMTLELAHVLGSEAIETATSAPMTYARLASLPVEIESCEFTPMVRDTSSRFTKITTVVRLRGRGEEGLGEDVTWNQIDHIEFLRHPMPHQIEGAWELAELSGALGEMDLFPVAPRRPASRRYRRWAFESAALDLGLRQAGLSLADALGRTPQPVRFVSSVRLGEPPSVEPIRARLQGDPTLEFKLDPTLSWSARTLRDIAATCRVRIIDLKGHYRNAAVQLPADAPLYARVLDAFPDAWIEDPAVTPETRPVLAEHLERVSWDEPIHSIEALKTVPGRPGALNIKPARFGSLRALFAAYDFCDATGIVPYGGGMFELGPGRGQLQYLASLFHPDAPNDLAPPEYNMAAVDGALPASPLTPQPHTTGFRWGPITFRRSIRDAERHTAATA